MKNSSIIIITLFIVFLFVCLTIFSIIIFIKPAEDDEEEIEDTSIDIYAYEILWEEQKANFSQEEINQNLIKLNLYRDDIKINGLFDGTCFFNLDFEIPEKFLKNVNITISWKDRFTGILGRTGRDKLYIDISTPEGIQKSVIEHMPIYTRFILNNILKIMDPNTYSTSININEKPPNMNIQANSSEEAIDIYWENIDVFEFNKGYTCIWEIQGYSLTEEIRMIRGARNFIRNLILNLISDSLKIDISYSYYTYNIVPNNIVQIEDVSE